MRIEVTKLIVAYCNFAEAPKKKKVYPKPLFQAKVQYIPGGSKLVVFSSICMDWGKRICRFLLTTATGRGTNEVKRFKG